MKTIINLFFVLIGLIGFSQTQKDSVNVYKKRVLEKTELDFISTYYTQDGDNAAVTGGIGTEALKDVASTVHVAIPLNDDDVFAIEPTISAYTSASSSNLNPFQSGASTTSGTSGASRSSNDDDDDNSNNSNLTKGSPWTEASGASKSDIWVNLNLSYSHSSDDRNKVWSANVNVANEFDYTSFGFGASHNWLFNKKNTEVGIIGSAYLDKWKPAYPTEIITYFKENGNINNGFFNGVEIFNQNGTITNTNAYTGQKWQPSKDYLVDNKNRNTYAVTLSFSQILSKKAQFSIFLDIVKQQGWLSNPMQRVYFKDINNFYIGNPASIDNYTSKSNTDVFQLADDIERLPNTRLKIPVGARFNYYINEFLVLKTYYRFYSDDWGIQSNTASIEMPIKVSDKFTLYPSYRYYDQTQADYFAGFEQHVSTNEFYTSDFDLSAFNANQYSFAAGYTDIFTKFKIWKFGLKSVDFKYSYYKRNTGLHFNIFSLGFKFVNN